MSPFRLFGRPARPVADEPDPWLDDPAPAPAAPAPARHPEQHPADLPTGTPVAGAGPATAAARPSLWTAHRPPQVEPAEPEPVTDPFGFAPVRPPVSRADTSADRAWAPDGGGARTAGIPFPQAVADPPVAPAPPAAPDPHPPDASNPQVSSAAPVASVASVAPVTSAASAASAAPAAPAAPVAPGPPVAPDPPASRVETVPPSTSRDPRADRLPAPNGLDPAAASALAGAFAADLLSWDEDDPARRGRALGAHLTSPEGAALLGWTGTGRQRADLVLPGRVRTDGERVHVDVRVRVVPYRRVDARAPGAPEPDPESPLGEPAAAPAASARGWRGLAAQWVRLEVAVVRAGDRLVVDAGPANGTPDRPSPADLAARGRSR
ncbi:hypothetical protein [Pseudonocardia parietis]|uniref:Uncharacterized protein n=1 Tax=Pseudonocardia parietis TaxID=570936 RepID=A0ABS4W4X8_9PSEU|nr:hypothetical protein [Pseudonocardia parietis]MBP2371163.1 hypothetical protein [Pseudonocardia parietis]